MEKGRKQRKTSTGEIGIQKQLLMGWWSDSVVEHLPSEHETLSSNLLLPKKSRCSHILCGQFTKTQKATDMGG
jgi:hypothetical protein